MTAVPLKAAPNAGALAHIRAFADQVRSAEDSIDKDSLATAEELRSLYDQKTWTTEWARIKPAAKSRGRKGKDDSENQFNLYIEHETGLSVSYSKRLMRAGKWMQNYGAPVSGKLSGERALRPMYAMERVGCTDDIPDVYRKAAEKSEVDTITGSSQSRV